MKEFLVFLTSVAVATEAGRFEGHKPGLRIKYGTGLDPSAGKKYFYDIPRTVAEAKAEGWKLTERPEGPLPQLIMHCPEDKVICCLFDDTGYIAGIQLAVSKTELSENVWERRGFISWNTTVDGEFKAFWINYQFFVNDDFLSISKQKRLASRDHSRTLQAGAVWVTFNNKILKIYNQEQDIIRENLFLKQACIPGMGQHYFFNMSKKTECTSDQIYPWFITTSNGELSAVAFGTLAKLKIPRCGRDWFERPTQADVKAIVPHGPPCYYKLAANPGALNMHIYFIDKPWTITCPAKY